MWGGPALLGRTLLMALLAVSLLWVGLVDSALGRPEGGSIETMTQASGDVSPLTISSFTVAPTVITNNHPIWLNVTAQGGVEPYTYWYTGLPPGCRSSNVSSLSCYPIDARHYEIGVTVNDSAGDHANATTNLTIKDGFGAPPEIKSFVAFPNTVAVNQLTYLTVVAVSESDTPTVALSYAFIGLPPGCGTFNQTNLSCIPNEPGMYQIWVRVTDGYSQFNQTYLFLNVTGTAPMSGSGSHPFSATTVDLVIVGIVVLAAIAAAVVYLRYIRKPPPPRAPPKAGSNAPEAGSGGTGPVSDGGPMDTTRPG